MFFSHRVCLDTPTPFDRFRTYVGSKYSKNQDTDAMLPGNSTVPIDLLLECPDDDLFGPNLKSPNLQISIFGGLVFQYHRTVGGRVLEHSVTRFVLKILFLLMLGGLSRPDATVEPSPSHGNLLGSSTIRYYKEVS